MPNELLENWSKMDTFWNAGVPMGGKKSRPPPINRAGKVITFRGWTSKIKGLGYGIFAGFHVYMRLADLSHTRGPCGTNYTRSLGECGPVGGRVL